MDAYMKIKNSLAEMLESAKDIEDNETIPNEVCEQAYDIRNRIELIQILLPRIKNHE